MTKKEFSLKGLLNFTMICIVISMIIGIVEIPIPNVVSDIFTSANACMGPVGMIMTGIIMSEFDVKTVFLNRKLYFVLFIRLILIPLAICFMLRDICSERVLMIAVLFYCLPCGLNSVIYPKLVNENCEIGVGLSMLSIVMSLISIPIIWAICF